MRGEAEADGQLPSSAPIKRGYLCDLFVCYTVKLKFVGMNAELRNCVAIANLNLNLLFHKTVLVAIDIQKASATELYPCFRISLRIKLYEMNFITCYICDK